MQKLKQILKPQHMPGDRPLSAQDAARAHASSSSSQQTSSADSIGRGTGSLGQSSSGSQQGDAAAPSTDEKMANWFAAVTPEDLNYFRTMTAEEFAGENNARPATSAAAAAGPVPLQAAHAQPSTGCSLRPAHGHSCCTASAGGVAVNSLLVLFCKLGQLVGCRMLD